MPDVRAVTIEFKNATPDSIVKKIIDAAKVMGATLPDPQNVLIDAERMIKASRILPKGSSADIVVRKNDDNSFEYFRSGEDNKSHFPFEAPADIPRM